MAKTLTIVARDARVPDPGDVLFDYGDVELQDVLTTKLANLNPDEHILERAGSVEELAAVLLKHKGSAGLKKIQIIAHGDVGELKIGVGKWGKPADQEGRTVVLDSDRGSYGGLLNCVDPKVEVLLLGCNVGECDPEVAGDGPILVFDLSHALGCKVSAPVEATYADHLGADGVYAGPGAEVLTTVTADGQVHVGTAAEDDFGPGGSPSVVLLRVTAAASTDRQIGSEGIDLRTDQQIGSRRVDGAHLKQLAQSLVGLIGPRAVRTPILAAPRFVFEATRGRGEEVVSAEVIANGRFVRLTGGDGKPDVFHTTDRAAVNKVLGELAVLLGLRAR